MYAIVEIAGKQYKVQKDDLLYVPRIQEEEKKKLTFDRVLLVSSGKTGVRLRAVPGPASSTSDTVVGALINMGYKRSEAEAAVGSAMTASDDANVEGLLRAALSALS